MNEIIAPIYYIFSFDKTYGVEPSIENIEADTFWTFNCLMTQAKDIFNREKDDKDIGLSGKVKRLQLMLKIVDYQLQTWPNYPDLEFYEKSKGFQNFKIYSLKIYLINQNFWLSYLLCKFE